MFKDALKRGFGKLGLGIAGLIILFFGLGIGNNLGMLISLVGIGLMISSKML